MDDTFFKTYLKDQLEKVFKANTTDGDLYDFVKYQAENEEKNHNEIKELQEKIKRLEDAVTTFQSIEEKKDNGKITLPVENVGTADKNENH
jgi:cephalosporin-C deacetylase-like acetyl esterase